VLRIRLKFEREGAKVQRRKEFNLFSSSRFRAYASSSSHLKLVTRLGRSHPLFSIFSREIDTKISGPILSPSNWRQEFAGIGNPFMRYQEK
jgi:hypothetical protein